MWMMVAENRVDHKIFVCPSSDLDFPDRLVDDKNKLNPADYVHHEASFFYDFAGYRNISYGYQVPWGPGDENRCRASSNSDSRLIVLADKSNFATRSNKKVNSHGGPDAFRDLNGVMTARYKTINSPPLYYARLYNLRPDSPKERWMRANSANHGGEGSGQGQNVYRMDGSVQWAFKPCVGVDNDNIYMHQTADHTTAWGANDPEVTPHFVMRSEAPWAGDYHLWPPGLFAIKIAGTIRTHGSTDSVLHP